MNSSIKMTGYRKCGHAQEHGDSVRRMTRVNRGARKIIAEGPDELTSMLTWTALAGTFVLLLVGATYLVLSVESPARPAGEPTPAAACATTRRLCSSCRDPRAVAGPQSRPGHPRDGITCRTSGLTELQGVGPGDVHYVFADVVTVPRMAVCSVESALRVADNDSRVNVFVINDVKDDVAAGHNDTPQRDPVSLSTGLSSLSAAYGDRLNVVRVGLDECAECTPFYDALPDLRRWPGMAEFAAQLAVLWQFGGTVLDPGVVAIRDSVYRANGTAVEYDDRTVSAPAACHAFIFDAMLQCVASCAARPDRQQWSGPFGPDATREVWGATATLTERAGLRDEGRPAPRWIIEGRDAVGGPSYYAETDGGNDDDAYRDFCPTVFAGTPSSSKPDSHDVASVVDDG